MEPFRGVIRRWFPVAGCWLVFFYSWGPILTFGVFQQYYEDTILSDVGNSAISWIGTLSGFLLFAVGIITGPLYDLGFFRGLFIAGSFLDILGLMMTSLASKYYQIILAQCICIGIGSGMLWTPSLSLIAMKFNAKKRALAIGIITSGSSIGGVIYPIMFKRLQPSIGFGWSLRCCGFLNLALAIIAHVLFLDIHPVKAPRTRQIIDKSAFKELHFLSLITTGFFSTMTYYVVLVFLPTFVATYESGTLSFYSLALVNGCSAFSRISAGFIAGQVGPLHAWIGALLFCSAVAFSWIAVHTLAGIIVWSIFWGMASGLIVSLPGAVVPLFTSDPTMLGTRMGMAWFPVGVGLLVSAPIGGAIIDSFQGKIVWWPLQVFAGGAITVSLFFCILPLMHLRKRRRVGS